MNDFTKRPLVNDYIPIGINRNPNFKSTDKVVFSLVYSMFQYTGIVFMTNRKMHNLLGISRRRVSQSIAMFKDIGLIKCITKMVTRNDGSKQRVRFIIGINYGMLQQLDNKILARTRRMYHGIAKNCITPLQEKTSQFHNNNHYSMERKIRKSNTKNSNTNIDNTNISNTKSSSSSRAPQEAPKDDDDDLSLKSNQNRKSNERSVESNSTMASNDDENIGNQDTAYSRYSQKLMGQSVPEYKLYNDDRKNKERHRKKLIMQKQSSKLLPTVCDTFDMERNLSTIMSTLEYKTREEGWTACGIKPQIVTMALVKALRNAKSRTIHSILNYTGKCVSAYFH